MLESPTPSLWFYRKERENKKKGNHSFNEEKKRNEKKQLFTQPNHKSH